MARLDPVTLEVIRHSFIAAADEMKINLMRTAYNPIIYEVLDFSIGLFDTRGRMISQAAGLPIFLGNLGEAIKTVTSDVGLENFQPGDVYLINDTYTTGTHLNDVTVISPIFVEGDLLAFAASRAHWLDVGSRDPGGWASDTTEIYQEGIRLRSVRLYEAGQLNPSIARILRDNVRFTESVLGDMRAQIAAGRTGERRFAEVVARFGRSVVEEAIAEIIRQGELSSREAVRSIPDGVYSAEAFLDDDGMGIVEPPVKVKVIVAGDTMTFDLMGSAPQCRGPINCGLAATISACRVAFKCLTTPFEPVNEGHFAPLRFIIPEDCMFNARLPAPSGVYGIILMTLIDVILKALSPAFPDKVPAGHYCDVCAIFISGVDPRTGHPFLHVEPEGGGWGAFSNRDGESVLIAIADGDTRNIPVEVIENRFPLLVERYELRQDSGGAGKFRGGLGHYRDYRVLAPSVRLTTIQERSKCPPWGLAGGKPAAYNTLVVNPDSPRQLSLQKATGLELHEGDVISVRTGGGGGYGDPLERDPERVREDVIDGYVSLEAARSEYGVIVDPLTFEVDYQATQARRLITAPGS